MSYWILGGLAAVIVAGGTGVVLVDHLRSQPGPQEEVVVAKPPQEQFAADRAEEFPTPAAFDGKRAMGYLEEICKIGPRISGTEGMKKQQELMEAHFKKHGGEVEYQRFSAKQISRPKPIEMANMIVRWKPDEKRRVILCSHYDTRPQADQEPDRRKWKEPFLSANDGGSGVALLMELAHHMKDLKLPIGVDFVFFDGEEYVFKEFEEENKSDKYFFGSEYFAQQAFKERTKRTYVGAVLLDMVAGKEKPKFPVEQNSALKAGQLVEQIYKIAEQQKCTMFRSKEWSKFAVQDDHLALNAVRIPAIDIIDFDYPHWHKLSDTPENCSGDTMAEVAKVVSVWIQSVK